MMKRTFIEISVLAGLAALASLILFRQLTLLKSKKKKIERSIDEVQPIETAINLLEVDVIDLLHTNGEIESGEYLKKCEGIAEALRENGYVIVRDSRVSITDNDAFLDMMERSAYYCNFYPTFCEILHIHPLISIGTMPNLMGSEMPVQNIIIKSVSHHLE
jgi:hypothetical protein